MKKRILFATQAQSHVVEPSVNLGWIGMEQG
jgi:hypothetical protein